MKRIKEYLGYAIFTIVFLVFLILTIMLKPINHTCMNPKITLYGETHGIEEFYDKELDKIENSYKRGIRDLFFECSYSAAGFLNLWLLDSDNKYLDLYFENLNGTLAYNEYNYNFMLKIKEKYPKLRFHGIDVDHQFFSTGEAYLDFLEKANLKDSIEYQATVLNIEQGKKYRNTSDENYRENCLYSNFINEYNKLDGKEIIGIFGSNHISLASDKMAGMLKQNYGDIIDTYYIENDVFYHESFTFGFASVGIIISLLLAIPSIVVYYKNRTNDKEKRILYILRTLLQFVAVVILSSLIDFNPIVLITSYGIMTSANHLFLIMAFGLIMMYYVMFFMYFKKRSISYGFKYPFETIPALIIMALGFYAFNYPLLIISMLLCILNISIHRFSV